MRDPRVDPRPGDVLRGDWPFDWERTVDHVEARRVWWHGMTKLYGSCCTAYAWRKWAATATVVRRGKEGE